MASPVSTQPFSGTYPMSSSRRHYPRTKVGERGASLVLTARPSSAYAAAAANDENFHRFLSRTAPTDEEMKDSILDKSSVELYKLEARYTGNRIGIAAPEEKLELFVKDRRAGGLPSALRPQALQVLNRQLRSSERGGRAPTGHPSDQFYDAAAARAPPQAVPVTTQKLENEFLETLEQSLRERELTTPMWDRYARRAEELLITMSLEKVLRTLKAFVLAEYTNPDLYTLIGAELAKEVRGASSTRLCQLLHWLARAGLRDQTLMSLAGNEALLRLHDDFAADMYIEVLNAHATLDVRNPRLIAALLRDLTPMFATMSSEQVLTLLPLTVVTVLTDASRGAYLARCAELNMGLPARMTKPEILRHFRFLEECLRLEQHPTMLPGVIQEWLLQLRNAELEDTVPQPNLSPLKEDVLRVLQQEMDIPTTPVVQDGTLTLHLVMGKVVLEILDTYKDYYVTPAMGGQRLLRATTKQRQRLLWRRGWRVLSFDEDEWLALKDDIFKKDLLEAVLSGQHNLTSRRPPASAGGHR